MPSLGNFDKLSARLAERYDIEKARAVAESIVTVGNFTLQFDSASRERMALVLKGSADGDQINWKMLDNSTVAFSKEELEELHRNAEIIAGQRILQVHMKAQDFKERLDAGERVTMRDIHLDNW